MNLKMSESKIPFLLLSPLNEKMDEYRTASSFVLNPFHLFIISIRP